MCIQQRGRVMSRVIWIYAACKFTNTYFDFRQFNLVLIQKSAGENVPNLSLVLNICSCIFKLSFAFPQISKFLPSAITRFT